jgi:type II secretory pathway component PulF
MQSVTLDQLIALSREISALAAAGLPLEEGLRRVADEFSGPSSALARRLAERLDGGADLAVAIDAEAEWLPESYRALVDAGLRSGNLASALAGYVDTAARMSELRRAVGLASLYPIFLIVVVWILFLVAGPVVLSLFEWVASGANFQVQSPRVFLANAPLWESVSWQGWLMVLSVPVALTLWMGLWWQRSAGAIQASTTSSGPCAWIPGIARIRKLSGQSNFADLLQLLIRHQTPLVDALPLAARASGLAGAEEASVELAARLAEGGDPRASSAAFRQLPPLVRLAFASGRGPENLAAGLGRAAADYRLRAETWARQIAFYLPLALTTLIGGTLVGLFAILMMQPYVAMLRGLAAL